MGIRYNLCMGMIPTRHPKWPEKERNGGEEQGLGQHLILELYGCEPDVLKNADEIKKILLKAVKAANFNILKIESHQFDPYGVTSMAIIGESHLSIHTWPEYGFAAADIFACSEKPWKATKVLIEELRPRKLEILEITRGYAFFKRDKRKKIKKPHRPRLSSHI